MEELPAVWFHVFGLGVGGIEVLISVLVLAYVLGYLWFCILLRG
jgi:hypothetical protein